MFKKLLAQYSNFMYAFMRGRYGMDTLNQHLTIGLLIVLVLNLFVRNSILSLLGTILWLIAIYRLLSKKFGPRAKENEKYLQLIKPLQPYQKLAEYQARDKEHKYFICVQCKQVVRVPKGRGKITITCPKCHYQFDKKS